MQARKCWKLVTAMQNTKIFSYFILFLQWKRSSQRQESASLINFDALAIALQRFSALMSKTLMRERRQPNSLTIGTYVPYRVDSEKCK